METEDLPRENEPDTSNLIEDNKIKEQGKANGSAKLRIKRFLGLVEPALFLAIFGANMSGVLTTNLLLIRTCEYMNLTNCSTMDSHPGGADEKIVQPYVTRLGMYKLLFESSIPAIAAFFIGPWSDTYGRRPLMIFPLIGYCLNFILLTGFAWFKIPPYFVLLTSAPLVFLGGSTSFYTGSFCYVYDTCPRKDVAYRLAITEGILYLGFLCGNTAGPFVYSLFPSHGFEGIFMIGFVVCLCSLLYVVFFLPESIIHNEHTVRERLKALFDYRQVIGLFRVCFSYHVEHARSVRLILVGVTMLSLISLEGTISVIFLFARNKFSWDITEFTIYSDAAFIMGICGTVFGTIVFSKWLKLPNAPLSCFAFFLKAASYVIAAFASLGWNMYLSSAVGALGGMASPLNRAIISDTVPKKDIGKLFSIISAFTAAVPMVAGPSYSLLYNSTINTFPGAFFLFSAAQCALCFVLLGAIIGLLRFYNPHPYSLTNSNQDQDQDQDPPIA